MSPMTLDDVLRADREALLALWAASREAPPPPRLSTPLLRRILAFDLQARQHGGLSPALRARIKRESPQPERATSPGLRPGARLLREWNGTTHVVDVTAAGYRWRDQTYRSLSAIAREITGAHWSGPRFFGLPKGKAT